MTHTQACIACGLLIASAAACQADIFRWDTGDVIPGTEFIEPGPGVYLGLLDLRFAALSNTNLSNVNLAASNLSSAKLTGTNLTNAFLYNAILTNADLAGANLTSAYLELATL